ncbi:MAG: glycosyltransferase family 2 protein [Parvularculaceae bacterium]
MTRVGAVIVNYNCAPWALDAALSILGDAGDGAEVVIVDNASPDRSADYFRTAADLPHAQTATAPRDVRFGETAHIAIDPAVVEPGVNVLLSPSNGGFAAGCNIGLKALNRQYLDLILLLNPDAMLGQGATDAFARRLADPGIGLCGASVVSFDAPHRAQALGGARLDPLTLLGGNLGAGLSLEEAPSTEEIENALDYPLGAAIAVERFYVERAGFLDERYFLYYEEADWAFAGRSFARVGWARDAVVYHRYGASSKSVPSATAEPSNRSPLSDYHMARSRLLFALKWRPLLAPSLVGLGGVQAAHRLMRGKPQQARAVALGSLPGAARAFPV